MNPWKGLSQTEVILLQKQYGKNRYYVKSGSNLVRLLLSIVKEPMFILLLIACILYFILHQATEGIMMAVTMVIVSAISIYQDIRSTRALAALKEFAEPKVKVIREGMELTVAMEELVPGDTILLEEGMKIPADAKLLEANDLFVNESIITGESVPVYKNDIRNDLLMQGSTIESGKCVALVTATGNNTMLGKIGKAISEYNYPKTHLQLLVNRFVKKLALFGFAGFIITLLINFSRYDDFVTSLLFALTLAMSVVPEEIPIAFSSFMALGAFKMSKHGIISRQPQIIENLGAITVLCLDKTGTITENKMEVKSIYDHANDSIINLNEASQVIDPRILLTAALASETNPFDSMEIAIHTAYRKNVIDGSLDNYKMVHEYPLEGKPPMMTHVYRSAGDLFTVAAKGAPERIFKVCRLDQDSTKKLGDITVEFARNGYRVLGVATASYSKETFPDHQDEFDWHFIGLLALYDPPRKNAGEVLKLVEKAGIEIKLLTGDHPTTAISIAKEVGLKTEAGLIGGETVLNMTDDELRRRVKEISIFARMFPDAKLKVINALKDDGQIVAMTGDGINDATALRSAHIGIAMGRKGTETARRASDLILTDDNLENITLALREGRKILNNLLKGIRYIISIHIPIILVASMPVLFGWLYPNIFTPVHVIFLELIMGPTCSVFFENEPVEKDLMSLPPRKRSKALFERRELLISIIQGLAITAGVLALYFVFMSKRHSLEQTRTVVFTTLMFSNLFLTFISRSYHKTIYHTIRYRNNLVPFVILISMVSLICILSIPSIRELFGMTRISLYHVLLCMFVAIISTGWFEGYKWIVQKVRTN